MQGSCRNVWTQYNLKPKSDLGLNFNNNNATMIAALKAVKECEPLRQQDHLRF